MSEIDKVYDEHKSCLERLESLQSDNAEWVDKYAEACRQRDAVKAQYDSLRALAAQMAEALKEIEREHCENSLCDSQHMAKKALAAYSKAVEKGTTNDERS